MSESDLQPLVCVCLCVNNTGAAAAARFPSHTQTSCVPAHGGSWDSIHQLIQRKCLALLRHPVYYLNCSLCLSINNFLRHVVTAGDEKETRTPLNEWVWRNRTTQKKKKRSPLWLYSLYLHMLLEHLCDTRREFYIIYKQNHMPAIFSLLPCCVLQIKK